MADKILWEQQISPTEYLRVQVQMFRGKEYISLRVWYHPDGTPEETLLPGKAGINMDAAKLPALAGACQAILTHIQENPSS